MLPKLERRRNVVGLRGARIGHNRMPSPHSAQLSPPQWPPLLPRPLTQQPQPLPLPLSLWHKHMQRQRLPRQRRLLQA